MIARIFSKNTLCLNLNIFSLNIKTDETPFYCKSKWRQAGFLLIKINHSEFLILTDLGN